MSELTAVEMSQGVSRRERKGEQREAQARGAWRRDNASIVELLCHQNRSGKRDQEAPGRQSKEKGRGAAHAPPLLQFGVHAQT